VLGSLGHVEGLRASGLITAAEHRKLRAGLRSALRAVERGRLVIGPEHEDAHSAVEHWLTRRLGRTGERTGDMEAARTGVIAAGRDGHTGELMTGLHRRVAPAGHGTGSSSDSVTTCPTLRMPGSRAGSPSTRWPS